MPLDILPPEILFATASESEPSYKALLAYPRFARTITLGGLIDYMIGFGHIVLIKKGCIAKNKDLHSIIASALELPNGMTALVSPRNIAIMDPM